jgi:outer membrane lipoprotein-sorting protein
MRHVLLLTAFLLLPAFCAHADPAALINPTGGPPASAGALPADATADQVLDALDETGQNLREFTATVSMKQGDPFAGNMKTRTGKVWFQKNGDNGRIRVLFDKLRRGNIIFNEKLEYVFNKDWDGWLIDRDYSKVSETRRQVLKPGEKLNLFKLGEGPFPLPIGQKKEEVRKMFDVTLVPPEGAPGPADSIHLQLKPKEGTRYHRRFEMIDVWVDRPTRFPAQITTKARGSPDVHETKLQNVKVNPGGLKDADFTPEAVKLSQWNVVIEPYKE